MRLSMAPDYRVEMQPLSVRALSLMWNLHPEACPKCVLLDDMQHFQQIRDSISLVRTRGFQDQNLAIFKSSIQGVKYLYHELKRLLMMAPHSHIVQTPHYFVTRRDQNVDFGELYRFILQYHARGNLADNLGARASTVTLSLKDQIRWAKELTATLMYTNGNLAGFYSDLKCDNILLSTSPDAVEHVVHF